MILLTITDANKLDENDNCKQLSDMLRNCKGQMYSNYLGQIHIVISDKKECVIVAFLDRKGIPFFTNAKLI